MSNKAQETKHHRGKVMLLRIPRMTKWIANQRHSFSTIFTCSLTVFFFTDEQIVFCRLPIRIPLIPSSDHILISYAGHTCLKSYFLSSLRNCQLIMHPKCLITLVIVNFVLSNQKQIFNFRDYGFTHLIHLFIAVFSIWNCWTLFSLKLASWPT